MNNFSKKYNEFLNTFKYEINNDMGVEYIATLEIYHDDNNNTLIYINLKFKNEYNTINFKYGNETLIHADENILNQLADMEIEGNYQVEFYFIGLIQLHIDYENKLNHFNNKFLN